MSSYNSGHGGGEEGSPVKRDDSMTVSNFHPDGRIFDHVNNSALEVGVWHRIVSNNVELLASKHASGNNFLTAVLPSESTASNVKRAVNPNAIQRVTAFYGNGKWPKHNQWSQNEINNMASKLLRTDNLDAQTYCSTISDNTDADTLQISWTFDTTNHHHTKFPPPCGAK